MMTKSPDEQSPIRKVKFTGAEDLRLIELVNRFGCADWKLITNHMKNRSVRQCRERWRHYLSPFVSHQPWTAAEDALLRQKVSDFGTKWIQITQFFPARTTVNLKNHWLAINRQPKPVKPPPVPAPVRAPPSAGPLFDQEAEKPTSFWNEPDIDWFGCSRFGLGSI
jgi:hypothetical protein